MSNPAPLLTDDSIAFLNGRVSIIAAASSIDLEPLLVRCTGCSIDSDRRVTLFLAASHAGALLAAVHTNGRIAAVFSEPTTHRTLQLKGDDAATVALAANDHHRVAAYRAAMVPELANFGLSAQWVHALLGCSNSELVAIRFTPREIFVQTPGPHAGAPALGALP